MLLTIPIIVDFYLSIIAESFPSYQQIIKSIISFISSYTTHTYKYPQFSSTMFDRKTIDYTCYLV